MPTLFDIEGDDLDLGYENIRNANHPIEQEFKLALDSLWRIYEPYADPNFKTQFSQNFDDRFWEMFIATQFLEEGKTLRLQSEIPRNQRGVGPDFCCLENNQKVWIEAVAPGPGDDNNPDQIPRLRTISETGIAQVIPRRQVQLRLSGALYNKKERFLEYKENGLISENEICIIAISTAKFWAQALSTGIDQIIRTVFPLDEEFASFNTTTGNIVETGYRFSPIIERTDNSSIPRCAFLDEEFANISGVIWARGTLGGIEREELGLNFLHNPKADNPLPENWFNWVEEFKAVEQGEIYELQEIT